MFGLFGVGDVGGEGCFRKPVPQREKGSDMFDRLVFVVIVVASFSSGAALAQEDRGTSEQRAACAPDAFRLCASYIPDPGRVESCLRQRMSDLSEGCRSVFDHAAATASIRGR